MADSNYELKRFQATYSTGGIYIMWCRNIDEAREKAIKHRKDVKVVFELKE